MKKLVIITISCLFLSMSCASVEKKSEVPNPASGYIEKVKKDPLTEIIDWWIIFDVVSDIAFD
jgi:hypothetical protein